jgi:anthranilate phosphoribosyltransferase
MSLTPQQMLERVLSGQSLDEPTATALLRVMASGELAPALAGAFALGEEALVGRDTMLSYLRRR